MKGLFIKDLQLIKTQKTFFFLITGICIWLAVSGSNPSTILSYAAAIFTILSVSTLNFDETENGMSFLLTFPISRRIYVFEKYALGVLLTAVVLAAGSVLMLAVAAVKSLSYSTQEWFSAVFGAMLTAALILSVTLPFHLKFGAEKGRIAMLAAIGCVAIVWQAAKLFPIDLSTVTDRIQSASIAEIAVCLSICIIGMLGISYLISAAIMKRKQF